MTEKSAITRRVVLTSATVGLAGASALVLAACAPATTSSGSGAVAAAEPSAAATGAAGTGSGGAIAALADIPVGGAKSVTVGGKGLLIAQPTAGNVVAFSSVCPHQGCAVGVAKTDFECPCHGSAFALATGDVTHGPAQTGLTVVAVKVAGDQIVTA